MTSATLIDQIFTNSHDDNFETIVVIGKLSDYFPILHFLSSHKPTARSKTLSSRDTSDAAINRFNDSLTAIGWDTVLQVNDPQIAFNNFSESFFSLHEIHMPTVTIKFNTNYHKIEPWITSGLLSSRRTKISMEKALFCNPCPASLESFKKFRNLYNRVLRVAKKTFFENELRANQSNAKKSWDLIRLALNKRQDKSSAICNISLNGTNISDPQLIANHFNEFFSSVASNIVDDINPTDPPVDNFSENVPLFSFTTNPVTGTEIIETVQQLQPKKTLDMTGISTWLLQKIVTAISVPLTHIFQGSLASGLVPNQLKIAKVIPVFKSGQKDSMDNYRPISLLSCFSKVIEKIVCNRLTLFLDSNNLITNAQYGFRKNHSTLHPLVHFANFVSTALDKKEHCVAIFCDLRKAFDTVNHAILLNKLKKMGIRGNELLWFQDYLSNRKQLVHVNGANSLLKLLSIGVPQGSILGPLLFLIYINDLPLCSELFALLFADDTTLLLSDTNLENLIAKVNQEFKKVSDFFRSHKLALHPAKTKFILFTNNLEARSSNVKILLNFNNNNCIQSPALISELARITVDSEIPAIKFLGIFIDPHLNFKYHIDYINKILRSL